MVNQTSPSAASPAHDSRAAVVGVAAAPSRRLSWGAIVAGAVTALALQVLLSMLGTGIGASTVDPLAGGGSPTAAAFGIGAALWWGLSSLLALLAGGWVAGRLSGMTRSGDGGLHGMLTWAVALLATVYLVSSAAGSLMKGAAGVFGTAATVTATGAAAPKIAEAAGDQTAKSGLSFDSIKREALALLSQTGKPGLQAGAVEQQAKSAVADAQRTAADPSDQDVSTLVERLLARGRDAASQVDREAVVNVVVARTGLSPEEAAKRVQGWETTAEQTRAKAAQAAEQAKQKAREVADASAQALSRGMLLGFLALALGALAAWWGGSMGQRRSAVLAA